MRASASSATRASGTKMIALPCSTSRKPMLSTVKGGIAPTPQHDDVRARIKRYSAYEANAQKRLEMHAQLLTVSTLLLGFTIADLSDFQIDDWSQKNVAELFAVMQVLSCCAFLWETLHCTLIIVGGTRMSSLDSSRAHTVFPWIEDETTEVARWFTASEAELEELVTKISEPGNVVNQIDDEIKRAYGMADGMELHMTMQAKKKSARHPLAFSFVNLFGDKGVGSMGRIAMGVSTYVASVAVRLGFRSDDSSKLAAFAMLSMLALMAVVFVPKWREVMFLMR